MRICLKVRNKIISKYHVTSYGTAPLLWISNNNTNTYNIFKKLMTDINVMDEIKELLDYDRRIEVYCVFLLLVRKWTDQRGTKILKIMRTVT